MNNSKAVNGVTSAYMALAYNVSCSPQPVINMHPTKELKGEKKIMTFPIRASISQMKKHIINISYTMMMAAIMAVHAMKTITKGTKATTLKSHTRGTRMQAGG